MAHNIFNRIVAFCIIPDNSCIYINRKLTIFFY